MDRGAVIIFGICAAPRLLAMTLWPSPTPTYYDELASGLLATGTFGFNGVPSTYMEPLYPAFLAAVRFLTAGSTAAVTLVQIAVAAIGGVLLYRLASHLAGPRAGVCASVIYALYPYLVRQSVAHLEITLCTTLAIAATLALTRTQTIRGAIGTGVLLGLLMLTRTSFVATVAGAALWLAWRPSTRLGSSTSLGTGPSTRLGSSTSLGTSPSIRLGLSTSLGRSVGGRLATVTLLTAIVVVTPWFLRNARIDGSPLPSRIGENLYLSTSAYASAVPVHDIDLLVPLALAEMGRLHLPPGQEARVMDDAMLARAFAFIREHPGRVLWLKTRNALYLLSPLMLPRDAKGPAAFAAMEGEVVRIVNAARRPWIEDASHAVVQAVLLLLAGVAMARRRISAADAPLLIMLGAQAAACIAFFPTTRLMAPVMFVVMFYAAAGLTGSSGAAPRRP